MSDRHIECATCKRIGPEDGARNIPTWSPENEAHADGYYCEEHAPAALEILRAQVEGLDLDDDARNGMAQLLLLIALLRARGLRTEDLVEDEAGGEGMERVRQQLLALLRRVADGARLPIVEDSALCSACFRMLPASQIHVIPWFNDSANDYVTTFRCGDCCPAALAETFAHFDAGADPAVVGLSEFFGRHGVVIHEYRRGAPPATMRPILRHVLDMISSGAMKLPVGVTVPLSSVLAPAPAEPQPPRRSLWSRLFGRP